MTALVVLQVGIDVLPVVSGRGSPDHFDEEAPLRQIPHMSRSKISLTSTSVSM